MNVLIYRLPRNLRIIGRSFCPNCHKHIRWYDNIPLVSFLLLHGRCRFCHSPISWQYPVVELLTGILFVLIFLELGIMNQELGFKNIVILSYYLFVVSSLIVIFFTDLRYGIIPDKVTYPAIVAVLAFLILSSLSTSGESSSATPEVFNVLFSALGAAGFLLLLNLITRGRGMGLGDVKLAVLMGLFLGFPKIIIALYASFLTGALVSLILILRGKKRFGQTIPFGPFLVVGTLFAFLIMSSL